MKGHSEASSPGTGGNGVQHRNHEALVFGEGDGGCADDFAPRWLLGMLFLDRGLSGDHLFPTTTHSNFLCCLNPFSCNLCSRLRVPDLTCLLDF